MSTAKPSRTPDELEDIILRKIFLVSLVDSMENDSRSVFLEMTAVEILSEGKDLKVSRDNLERIIIDRLSGDFPAAEPPFHYLIDCYRRAYDEGRKIASIKDKNVRSELESAVRQSEKLAVSYCRIHLGNPYMFPNPDANKSNASPLLPLIFSEVGGSLDGFGASNSRVSSCPPGFLDEFFRDADYDTMEPILMQLYADLRGSVLKVSALGNFQQPLRALLLLVNYPVGAEGLVKHPWWIPKSVYLSGRKIEMTSILGPFFHVSALPDHVIFKSEPEIGLQCFSDASSRLPADLLSSFTTIKSVLNNLYDGLSETLTCLLKNTSTRENVIEYLAQVINRNSSRAQLQADPLSSASSGMFVNLSAVMLRLCEPFLDANLTKRDKLDPKYVFYCNRLELRGLTALHATSENVSEWFNINTTNSDDLPSNSDGQNRLLQSQNATSSSKNSSEPSALQNSNPTSKSNEKAKYSFICECFFMTARVLNLGLIKAFSDFKLLVQDISRCEDALTSFKAMQDQAPSPQLHQDISRLEREIDLYTQKKLCYEAQILRDEGIFQRALSYYRLMVVWLVDLVGGFKMPLPASCPKEFASMPEHFVEDAMELLIFASRIRELDGVMLEDFMNFIIMFMASPEYIRNPYLRAKMVEVLNCWMPQKSGSKTLFEGHQLSLVSLEYLVRNLRKLYMDIEFTGSHTQFYDKFNIRHNIAELIEYLWQVPGHLYVWRKMAKEGEMGVYVNFRKFLLNDSIFLLDETLKNLELLLAETSNTVEWERRPAQERQERRRLWENNFRVYEELIIENIRMLEFTWEQIIVLQLPKMFARGPKAELKVLLKMVARGLKAELKVVPKMVARGLKAELKVMKAEWNVLKAEVEKFSRRRAELVKFSKSQQSTKGGEGLNVQSTMDTIQATDHSESTTAAAEHRPGQDQDPELGKSYNNMAYLLFKH